MIHRFINTIIDSVFPPMCFHCRREGAWICPEACHQMASLKPLINPLPIDGIDRVICAGSYDHPLLAKLVTGIKYHGYTAYRPVVHQILSPLQPLIEPMDCIPVPLHATRQRSRGFNQSTLIAGELATIIGCQATNILDRSRSTRTQTALTERARRHNVEHAFRLSRRVETVPERGILVDDVITTGSTIQECASVLRQAGMKQITAVALAKG